jgi:hypothetical protein
LADFVAEVDDCNGEAYKGITGSEPFGINLPALAGPGGQKSNMTVCRFSPLIYAASDVAVASRLARLAACAK